jgi:hypothetical protein
MAGRFLVGFVWLNLLFCGMVGRLSKHRKVKIEPHETHYKSTNHDTEKKRLSHTNPTKNQPTMTQKTKD